MEKSWDHSDIKDSYKHNFLQYSYKIHREASGTIKNNEDTEYQFQFQDANSRLELDEGYVYLLMKITKADGSSVGDDLVTFVNTGNPFSNAKLYIGGVLAETIRQPFLISHINGLINYTNDYVKSQPSSMLYFLDTNNTSDIEKFNYDDATKKVTMNDSYNEGFSKRLNKTKNSASVEYMYPLVQLFSFYSDFKKCTKLIPVEIVFARSKDADMIFTNKTNLYKVIIEDLSLWIPHPTFSLKNDLTHLSDLQKVHNLTWCSPKLEVSNSFNTITGTWSFTSNTDEVLSVYVFAQYDEKDRNRQQNNMIFDNLGVEYMKLSINDDSFPTYTEESFKITKLYQHFLSAGLNNINTESGSIISEDLFKKLYFISVFDTSNHQDYTDGSILKIDFTFNLKAVPAKPFRFFFILNEKKKGVLDYKTQLFTLKNTLRK